jgi:hypothetical protein
LNPKVLSFSHTMFKLEGYPKNRSMSYLLKAIHIYSRKGVHDIFGSWYVSVLFLRWNLFYLYYYVRLKHHYHVNELRHGRKGLKSQGFFPELRQFCIYRACNAFHVLYCYLFIFLGSKWEILLFNCLNVFPLWTKRINYLELACHNFLRNFWYFC